MEDQGGCLQNLVLFCALFTRLHSCVCALLRSIRFALVCAFAYFCVRPRLERPRLGTSNSYFSLLDVSFLCLTSSHCVKHANICKFLLLLLSFTLCLLLSLSLCCCFIWFVLSVFLSISLYYTCHIHICWRVAFQVLILKAFLFLVILGAFGEVETRRAREIER